MTVPMQNESQSRGASAVPDVYDVVVSGGGLAGLSLSRHLKLTNADLSVLVLDKLRRPLPEVICRMSFCIWRN